MILASSVVASVPSEATSIFTRLKGFPFTNSSRLYPPTRRMILG